MMTFIYYNRGVPTPFNPEKKVTILGQTMTALELHKDLVRSAARRDVFITDHKGREVDCSLIEKAA